MALKTGDLVILKSGGPLMTLGDQLMGEQYRCHWFEGNKAQTANYPLAALVAAPEPEK